jgi:hypothetical protein
MMNPEMTKNRSTAKPPRKCKSSSACGAPVIFEIQDCAWATTTALAATARRI